VSDYADEYLVDSIEVYRRALPSGFDVAVRLSSRPYASVFGLTWNAPTGSAEECLGDRAMFLGEPGHIGSWGSAWTGHAWTDSVDSARPVVLRGFMRAAGDAMRTPTYAAVSTRDDIGSIVLSNEHGDELDRPKVMNQMAVIVIPAASDPSMNGLWITPFTSDGRALDREPLQGLLDAPHDGNVPPSDCGPGSPPQRPLPAPGEPPPDAAAAEARIRERYAALVDVSVPFDEKDEDLLDDVTGVAAAIDQVMHGQFKDEAATASYTIDELVFTGPHESWFRYTITTDRSTFSDRFGVAIFNGLDWQITRATLCQDLGLALAPCSPSVPPNEPPLTPEWEAAWQEWMALANLYMGNDGCPPLSQC
jgi:hypothetical protein